MRASAENGSTRWRRSVAVRDGVTCRPSSRTFDWNDIACQTLASLWSATTDERRCAGSDSAGAARRGAGRFACGSWAWAAQARIRLAKAGTAWRMAQR
jgi:hypothetical protein